MSRFYWDLLNSELSKTRELSVDQVEPERCNALCQCMSNISRDSALSPTKKTADFDLSKLSRGRSTVFSMLTVHIAMSNVLDLSEAEVLKASRYEESFQVLKDLDQNIKPELVFLPIWRDKHFSLLVLYNGREIYLDPMTGSPVEPELPTEESKKEANHNSRRPKPANFGNADYWVLLFQEAVLDSYLTGSLDTISAQELIQKSEEKVANKYRNLDQYAQIVATREMTPAELEQTKQARPSVPPKPKKSAPKPPPKPNNYSEAISNFNIACGELEKQINNVITDAQTISGFVLQMENSIYPKLRSTINNNLTHYTEQEQGYVEEIKTCLAKIEKLLGELSPQHKKDPAKCAEAIIWFLKVFALSISLFERTAAFNGQKLYELQSNYIKAITATALLFTKNLKKAEPSNKQIFLELVRKVDPNLAKNPMTRSSNTNPPYTQVYSSAFPPPKTGTQQPNGSNPMTNANKTPSNGSATAQPNTATAHQQPVVDKVNIPKKYEQALEKIDLSGVHTIDSLQQYMIDLEELQTDFQENIKSAKNVEARNLGEFVKFYNKIGNIEFCVAFYIDILKRITPIFSYFEIKQLNESKNKNGLFRLFTEVKNKFKKPQSQSTDIYLKLKIVRQLLELRYGIPIDITAIKAKLVQLSQISKLDLGNLNSLSIGDLERKVDEVIPAIYKSIKPPTLRDNIARSFILANRKEVFGGLIVDFELAIRETGDLIDQHKQNLPTADFYLIPLQYYANIIANFAISFKCLNNEPHKFVIVLNFCRMLQRKIDDFRDKVTSNSFPVVSGKPSATELCDKLFDTIKGTVSTLEGQYRTATKQKLPPPVLEIEEEPRSYTGTETDRKESKEEEEPIKDSGNKPPVCVLPASVKPKVNAFGKYRSSKLLVRKPTEIWEYETGGMPIFHAQLTRKVVQEFADSIIRSVQGLRNSLAAFNNTEFSGSSDDEVETKKASELKKIIKEFKYSASLNKLLNLIPKIKQGLGINTSNDFVIKNVFTEIEGTLDQLNSDEINDDKFLLHFVAAVTDLEKYILPLPGISGRLPENFLAPTPQGLLLTENYIPVIARLKAEIANVYDEELNFDQYRVLATNLGGRQIKPQIKRIKSVDNSEEPADVTSEPIKPKPVEQLNELFEEIKADIELFESHDIAYAFALEAIKNFKEKLQKISDIIKVLPTHEDDDATYLNDIEFIIQGLNRFQELIGLNAGLGRKTELKSNLTKATYQFLQVLDRLNSLAVRIADRVELSKSLFHEQDNEFITVETRSNILNAFVEQINPKTGKPFINKAQAEYLSTELGLSGQKQALKIDFRDKINEILICLNDRDYELIDSSEKILLQAALHEISINCPDQIAQVKDRLSKEEDKNNLKQELTAAGKLSLSKIENALKTPTYIKGSTEAWSFNYLKGIFCHSLYDIKQEEQVLRENYTRLLNQLKDILEKNLTINSDLNDLLQDGFVLAFISKILPTVSYEHSMKEYHDLVDLHKQALEQNNIKLKLEFLEKLLNIKPKHSIAKLKAVFRRKTNIVREAWRLERGVLQKERDFLFKKIAEIKTGTIAPAPTAAPALALTSSPVPGKEEIKAYPDSLAPDPVAMGLQELLAYFNGLPVEEKSPKTEGTPKGNEEDYFKAIRKLLKIQIEKQSGVLLGKASEQDEIEKNSIQVIIKFLKQSSNAMVYINHGDARKQKLTRYVFGYLAAKNMQPEISGSYILFVEHLIKNSMRVFTDPVDYLKSHIFLSPFSLGFADKSPKITVELKELLKHYYDITKIQAAYKKTKGNRHFDQYLQYIKDVDAIDTFIQFFQEYKAYLINIKNSLPIHTFPEIDTLVSLVKANHLIYLAAQTNEVGKAAREELLAYDCKKLPSGSVERDYIEGLQHKHKHEKKTWVKETPLIHFNGRFEHLNAARYQIYSHIQSSLPVVSKSSGKSEVEDKVLPETQFLLDMSLILQLQSTGEINASLLSISDEEALNEALSRTDRFIKELIFNNPKQLDNLLTDKTAIPAITIRYKLGLIAAEHTKQGLLKSVQVTTEFLNVKEGDDLKKLWIEKLTGNFILALVSNDHDLSCSLNKVLALADKVEKTSDENFKLKYFLEYLQEFENFIKILQKCKLLERLKISQEDESIKNLLKAIVTIKSKIETHIKQNNTQPNLSVSGVEVIPDIKEGKEEEDGINSTPSIVISYSDDPVDTKSYKVYQEYPKTLTRKAKVDLLGKYNLNLLEIYWDAIRNKNSQVRARNNENVRRVANLNSGNPELGKPIYKLKINELKQLFNDAWNWMVDNIAKNLSSEDVDVYEVTQAMITALQKSKYVFENDNRNLVVEIILRCALKRSDSDSNLDIVIVREAIYRAVSACITKTSTGSIEKIKYNVLANNLCALVSECQKAKDKANRFNPDKETGKDTKAMAHQGREDDDAKLIKTRRITAIWLNHIYYASGNRIEVVREVIAQMPSGHQKALFSLFNETVNNTRQAFTTATDGNAFNPTNPFGLLSDEVAALIRNINDVTIEKILEGRIDDVDNNIIENHGLFSKIIKDTTRTSRGIEYILKKWGEDKGRDEATKAEIYPNLVFQILVEYKARGGKALKAIINNLSFKQTCDLLYAVTVYPTNRVEEVQTGNIVKYCLLEKLTKDPTWLQSYIIEISKIKSPRKFIDAIKDVFVQFREAIREKETTYTLDDLVLKFFNAFSDSRTPSIYNQEARNRHFQLLRNIMAAYDECAHEQNWPYTKPILQLINDNFTPGKNNSEYRYLVNNVILSPYQILTHANLQRRYSPEDILNAFKILIPSREDFARKGDQTYTNFVRRVIRNIFNSAQSGSLAPKNLKAIFDKIMLGLEQSKLDKYNLKLRFEIINVYISLVPRSQIATVLKNKDIKRHIVLWLKDKALCKTKREATAKVDKANKIIFLVDKIDYSVFGPNTSENDNGAFIFQLLCDVEAETVKNNKHGSAGTIVNELLSFASYQSKKTSNANSILPFQKGAQAFIVRLFEKARPRKIEYYSIPINEDLQSNVHAQVVLASLLYKFYKMTKSPDGNINELTDRIKILLQNSGIDFKDAKVICSVAILKSSYSKKVIQTVVTAIAAAENKVAEPPVEEIQPDSPAAPTAPQRVKKEELSQELQQFYKVEVGKQFIAYDLYGATRTALETSPSYAALAKDKKVSGTERKYQESLFRIQRSNHDAIKLLDETRRIKKNYFNMLDFSDKADYPTIGIRLLWLYKNIGPTTQHTIAVDASQTPILDSDGQFIRIENVGEEPKFVSESKNPEAADTTKDENGNIIAIRNGKLYRFSETADQSSQAAREMGLIQIGDDIGKIFEEARLESWFKIVFARASKQFGDDVKAAKKIGFTYITALLHTQSGERDNARKMGHFILSNIIKNIPMAEGPTVLQAIYEDCKKHANKDQVRVLDSIFFSNYSFVKHLVPETLKAILEKKMDAFWSNNRYYNLPLRFRNPGENTIEMKEWIEYSNILRVIYENDTPNFVKYLREKFITPNSFFRKDHNNALTVRELLKTLFCIDNGDGEAKGVGIIKGMARAIFEAYILTLKAEGVPVVKMGTTGSNKTIASELDYLKNALQNTHAAIHAGLDEAIQGLNKTIRQQLQPYPDALAMYQQLEGQAQRYQPDEHIYIPPKDETIPSLEAMPTQDEVYNMRDTNTSVRPSSKKTSFLISSSNSPVLAPQQTLASVAPTVPQPPRTNLNNDMEGGDQQPRTAKFDELLAEQRQVSESLNLKS